MITPLSLVLAALLGSNAAPHRVPGIVGLAPGEATFEEVSTTFAGRRLEDGDLERTGQESEQRIRLCFISENPNDKTVLVFESGVEGGWRLVTDYVRGERLPDEVSRDRCRASKLVGRRLATSNGLRLGLSKSDAMRRIPAIPAKRSASEVVYRLDYSRTPTPEEARAIQGAFGDHPGLLVSGYSRIELWFRRDRLVKIRVARSETL